MRDRLGIIKPVIKSKNKEKTMKEEIKKNHHIWLIMRIYLNTR
jgi:hypothetical protein